MKMTTRILASLLIIISAGSAIAGVDSVESSALCKIVALKGHTYKVIYQSGQKEDVTVKLTDSRNQVIYSEKIAGIEGFMKNYNLKNLPVGKYTLQVKSADYTYSEDFELGSLRDYRVLLSQVEDKKVMFVGFLPSAKDLTLYILDDHHDVLYSESIKDIEVKKSYNLEKIAGGNVTFVIYQGGTLVQEKKFYF